MKHHTYIVVSEKMVGEIKGDFGVMIPVYIAPEDFKLEKIEELTKHTIQIFKERMAHFDK